MPRGNWEATAVTSKETQDAVGIPIAMAYPLTAKRRQPRQHVSDESRVVCMNYGANLRRKLGRYTLISIQAQYPIACGGS